MKFKVGQLVRLLTSADLEGRYAMTTDGKYILPDGTRAPFHEDYAGIVGTVTDVTEYTIEIDNTIRVYSRLAELAEQLWVVSNGWNDAEVIRAGSAEQACEKYHLQDPPLHCIALNEMPTYARNGWVMEES